jgi:general secretion pathway protein B
MSYILDALKKADQERTLGEVPDLEAAHWGERRQKRSYRWVWVVGALLLVNGFLLFMLLDRDEPFEHVVDGLPETAESPAVTPVVPVPRTESAMTTPSSDIVRPREPVYVPLATVGNQRQTTVRPLPSTPAVVDQSTGFTRPAVPAPTSRQTSGVPAWSDLSLEFRSGLSLPHLDVHVYSENPKKRFILVDLQKFREGDTLDNGAVLEEILPDSIQLYYQGTRFLVEK